MTRIAALLSLTCCIEVSGHPIVLGPPDGGSGRPDAAVDASDAGSDGGSDAGSDADMPPDAGCPDCPPRVIDIVTRTPTGEAADGRTFLFYDISPTGRYIGFAARAENIVVGDANGFADVFLLDRVLGTTVLASTTATGEQANGDSSFVSISDDGRFVAFGSVATNLVAADTNGVRDVFVKDLMTGAVERVSVASDGRESDGEGFYVSMSADARFVAFKSLASNLVAGDDNAVWDVYLRDRTSSITMRVSESATGASANGESDRIVLSADGRYLAYSSAASNLVPDDTNRVVDIFIYDRVDRTTTRASMGAGGEEANSGSATPFVTADGRYVVFISAASNLAAGDTNGEYDAFLVDRATGRTERVDIGDGGRQASTGSIYATVSDDGRFVAFASADETLVSGDTNGASDVFVRDRSLARTFRIVTASGQPNASSQEPVITGRGDFVLFRSAATNWVPIDENSEPDIFVAPVDPL